MGSDHSVPKHVAPHTGFQSTLPVWGATNSFKLAFAACRISIHAPRVGSDTRVTLPSLMLSRFQSTLPVWGATQQGQKQRGLSGISIHAPRVGSDREVIMIMSKRSNFNPRSPCGERPGSRKSKFKRLKFQSTLPVWGATLIAESNTQNISISIHAPRVGSDA